MRLTDADVAIRPRSAWEAIDLGVLFARRHAGLLMASWALVTLPVFALLCLLLWESPSWALFIFWWLKPAYERLPLYILSQAMFGERPTLKQAMKAFARLLKPQLLASLTWRRLSPTRSFDLPVTQLEGLSGAVRSQRLQVLGQRDAGGATWLTLVGVNVEIALWLGLGTLFYLMLPQQMEMEWNWQSLVSAVEGQWLWLEHLSNFAYALLLIVWEPVYVACGFTLYLNRRTALEAWDIELVFRQLRQRLTGVAYALLLGAGLLLLQAPAPALAEQAQTDADAAPGPDAPRLLRQALSSATSRQDIQRLLDAPPFENRETVTRWRFAEEKPDQEQDKAKSDLFERLLKRVEHWDGIPMVASLFEVLLWALLFGLLGFLLWHYRDWLTAFGIRLPGRPTRAPAPPSQLFGLEVSPQSLPDDIAGEVERLWADSPRAALGLLYRALLSRLLHDHRLPLKSAHTEGEVLDLVGTLEHAQLARFSTLLTRDWQNLAYGHLAPPQTRREALCRDWRELFEHGGARP